MKKSKEFRKLCGTSQRNLLVTFLMIKNTSLFEFREFRELMINPRKAYFLDLEELLNKELDAILV